MLLQLALPQTQCQCQSEPRDGGMSASLLSRQPITTSAASAAMAVVALEVSSRESGSCWDATDASRPDRRRSTRGEWPSEGCHCGAQHGLDLPPGDPRAGRASKTAPALQKGRS